MIPLRLRLHAYKTFDDLELDLPDGLVAILGDVRDVDGVDSNGAGKSSLLEAVEVALFGRRSLQPYHQRGAVDDLEVELEFAHAGERYRCRRTYNPRGRGKTAFDLERLTGADGWEPLTLESAKATQERLERIVGFSQTTWRNSFYLRQGDGSFADPALDPRHRRQLLSDALGLGLWDTLRDRARADVRTAEQQLHELEGRVQAARELASTRADVLAAHAEAHTAELGHADTLADRERAHQELGQRWQVARERAARRQAAEAELAGARAALAHLETLQLVADEAVAARAVTTDELDLLPGGDELEELQQRIAALEAEVANHERRASAHVQASQEADQVAKRVVMLQERAGESGRAAAAVRDRAQALELADAAVCQTCGQHVADDAKARAIASYIEEAASHEASAARDRAEAAATEVPVVPSPPEGAPPVADLQAARARVRALVDAAAQRARLQERLVALQQTIDARPSPEQIEEAWAAVNAKQLVLVGLAPVDIAALEQQGLAAKRDLDAAKVAFETARTARVRLEERLAQISAAEQQIEAAAADRATVEQALELAAALERAYGPSGIPALVLENTAIPAIETEANRCLAILGCPYTVELRTQAQRKSGDGVRDTLDVVIIDPTGDEAPFEECTSGGEKTRIGVALRVGLGLLLDRRGAGSGLLALDEPGWLDETGMAALLTFLESLQPVFPKIYVISHVPALRDSFDEVLTVVKDDGGRSSVVEQGMFEPVPA